MMYRLSRRRFYVILATTITLFLGIHLICRELTLRQEKVATIMSISEKKISPSLAWILHFNYEPKYQALKTLLQFYSSNFKIIVIVSPTGRIGQLKGLDTSDLTSEVIWSPPCPNYLHDAVAGLMMRCYSTGLQLLQASSKFKQIEFVVLSNDDVVINMTKVREFAREGHPVSHVSPPRTAPPIFAPPEPGIAYFDGWHYASWWPECQERFNQVPIDYKNRFRERYGDCALQGGVDIFLLPPSSVPEFIFLSNLVSECWIEISIPNALAMLSIPVKFYRTESNVLVYRWMDAGKLVSPADLEVILKSNSILSFHPFKLSFPSHRHAFSQLMTKYKLM